MNSPLVSSPRHLLSLLACLLAGALPTRGLAQAGSLDPGFKPGTISIPTSGAEAWGVLAVAVQADGKTLLGGGFDSVNGVPRSCLARLNADGSLDAAFNPVVGKVGDLVNALAVQSDGRIVVGGGFLTINGVARNGLARLNADGSVDAGFDPVGLAHGFMAQSFVDAVALQSDGRVLVAGGLDGNKPYSRVARLNPDGSVDPGFAATLGGFALAMSLQPDGKILLGGISLSNGTASTGIARLNVDGSTDPTFNRGGTGTDAGVFAVAVQADGKIVLGGEFNLVNLEPRKCVARLNADGSLDASFIPSTGRDSAYNTVTVKTVVVQADGRIVLGGDFVTVTDVVARRRVARLNADGSLDLSFNGSAGRNGDIVNAAALQSDGKIVLGGGSNATTGVVSNFGVTRLLNVPSAFFNGDEDVGSGFSFLSTFGYYKLLPTAGYVYHNDLGFLFFIDANDGKGGIYFYDFATTATAQSLGFLYTSPSLFPYLYSFGLNTFVYYFPDPPRGAGFYTTAPRVFSRLDTGEVLFR